MGPRYCVFYEKPRTTNCTSAGGEAYIYIVVGE